MVLHINGEQKEFPEGLTLAALVAHLGMKPDRVAVELNQSIVQRGQWEHTALHTGDSLEIVHFVGGGSGRESHVRDAPGGEAVQSSQDEVSREQAVLLGSSTYYVLQAFRFVLFLTALYSA